MNMLNKTAFPIVRKVGDGIDSIR